MGEFEAFGKIPRLRRNCVITEKIDGTNAQVYVKLLEGYDEQDPACIWQADGAALFAGSRNRWITPAADNFGFAKWVKENAEALSGLGEGRHFGEWWGSGVQRGYGLTGGEKRFSLFNTARWIRTEEERVPQAPLHENRQRILPACCSVVPVLYSGMFSTEAVDSVLESLGLNGSAASPGFMNPEGVVVYLSAGRSYWKQTLEKDEEPKGKVA